MHYVILCYIILYYNLLYYITLHYIILYYIVCIYIYIIHMGLPQKFEKTLKPSGLGPRCICDLIVILGYPTGKHTFQAAMCVWFVLVAAKN